MGNITTAMVLAAGFGKRMRPITDTIPKPLVPVNGITLLDRILNNLSATGIKKVVVNGHYLADVLESYLIRRNQQQPGQPHITFSYEDAILETGGGIVKALPLLGDEPFLIINGDVLWLDDGVSLLQSLAEVWDSRTMDGLLVLHPVEKAMGYEGKGDFDLAADGQLIRSEDGNSRTYVFAGISIMHPRLFVDLPSPPFSLNQLYWRAKQPDGRLKRFYGLVHQGEWLHIGTPEGLKEAEVFLRQHTANVAGVL